MSKRILVMGATSGIGKAAMDEGLARGFIVRAFSRSDDQLEQKDNLEIAAGDALDPADVASALDGVDAVVYALGIQESVSMLWKEVTLFSETTRILLSQMAQAGVSRLIVTTGFGAGRSRAAMSTIERLGHRAILGKPYEDKDRQETLLLESDVEWTIVRPVILTNADASQKYRVLRDPAEWRNGLISRKDVASYLIEAVTSDEDIRRDVVLAR